MAKRWRREMLLPPITRSRLTSVAQGKANSEILLFDLA